MGIPDESAGEAPKAFIVLKAGAVGEGSDQVEKPREVCRELIAFVREKKVRHKWIQEMEVVEAIPKSASGKILRRVFLEWMKQGKRGVVVKAERMVRAKL